MAILPSQRQKQDEQNAINNNNYYYGQAQGYMNPYTANAGTDFNTGRNLLYAGGKARLAQPHYGQEEYKILDMTPEQLDAQVMAGYSESPLAKEEMQYGLSAANSQLNANGMGMSPDEQMVDAQIGNTIGNEDMSRYLGLTAKTAGIQKSAMSDYEKQNQELVSLFRDMLGTENKASSFMANDAQRTGQSDNNIYGREMNNERFFDPIGQVASILGAGAGLYKNSGSSGGYGNPYEDPNMSAYIDTYGTGGI